MNMEMRHGTEEVKLLHVYVSFFFLFFYIMWSNYRIC
ncbi:hypothetical protein E2C01_009149 [Portunus trituberculatus]|uniref:Uncharacterized protein n=1 Tax=Portunus trituberculatus TaxID=210409 RepID=A0A5B7D4Q1_PORTR|nr:hypothetical protein [Portunus trituberculatus]